MIDYIVQISAILSPIIAVLLAWWASRSSAKDTAKQIAALEESTQKQVESIKELTCLQLRLTKIQFEKELTSARYQYALIADEVDNAKKINGSILGTLHNDFTKEERRRREKEMNLQSKEEYYSKQISLLNGSLQKLTELKKEVDSHD